MSEIQYRSCPECNVVIEYKTGQKYKRACKNNTKCRKCAIREAIGISQELVNRILEMNSEELYNREIARQLDINHRTVSECLKKFGKESKFANQPIDKISETEARCSRCREIKSISEFQFGRKGQKYEYKFSYCNACRKQQVYLNLNSDVEKFLTDRYNRLKRRSKKMNIPFSISKDEFIDQFYIQNGKCFYTDVDMVCEVGSGSHRNSFSIDKIIPENGYVKDNIVFCSVRINTCKNDLTLEEIKLWMPSWYERINKFLNKDK